MVKRVKKSTQSVTGFEFFWLFRKQLDHRTLNYFDGKLKLNPQQIKLAAILTHHPYSGMQMAVEIRRRLNITQYVAYPLIPDPKYDHVAQSARLIDFVTRSTPIEVRNLASQICKDMKYDSLTWQMPYLCWILTSVLPIPPDGHAIEVSGTATYDPQLSVRHGVKALKSLNNPQFIAQGIEQGFRFVEEAASGMNPQEVSSKTSAALFSLGMKRITYPAILLRGYASKNAMIQWVTDNYDRAVAPLYEHDARKYVDKVTLTSVLLGITTEIYDTKQLELEKLKDETTQRISQLISADKEYFVTAHQILRLTTQAHRLFLSSNAEQKNRLLKMVLANCTIEDEIIRYTVQKPFIYLLPYTKRQLWLPG